jgi:hypothetical protein
MEVVMYRLLIASMAYSTAASSFTCVVNDPSPCGSNGGLFILVSPSVVVVSVGETLTPRASWCHDGRYDNVPAQWSLAQAADANIITLDATTGRITGRRTGQAKVIATYEGTDGAAVQVTVR